MESRNLKNWPHWPHFGSWEALCKFIHKASHTIGVMVYRKNGWTCVRPEHERGALVTKVLTAGKTLSINAATGPGGSVRVEVLNAAGQALPAYSGRNAAAFSGDSTQADLTWSAGAVKELPAEPLRLRVTIANADLYAIGW